MRVKRKNSKPESLPAAAAKRSESAPSAHDSIQSKSRNSQAISTSSHHLDNSLALKQLKEHKQDSVLQAIMQGYKATEAGNGGSLQAPEAAKMGNQALSVGQVIGSKVDSGTSHALGTDGESVTQRALLPSDAFKAQFKDNKERKSNINEYHAQICDDLNLYHKHEYDPGKGVSEEISLKYDIRKMALERVVLGCNLWLHYPVGKPPSDGSRPAWDAVERLKNDATAELATFYENAEGRSALHALLAAKAQQKQVDVYSVDEFKGDADLGVVSSNVGDMGPVVGKLKAFHAIEEKPNDDSTRAAKLKTLDALMQLANTAQQSIHDTQKRKSYKATFPGFWQDLHTARLNALDKLVVMLKNNRGKYEDPLSWRMSLQNLASRNQDALAGTGVSMKDVDADWVEVDDGYASANELAAETDEIVKRLSGGEGS